jgi:hypothetical protein
MFVCLFVLSCIFLPPNKNIQNVKNNNTAVNEPSPVSVAQLTRYPRVNLLISWSFDRPRMRLLSFLF